MMMNGHIMDRAANIPDFDGIVKSVSSDEMVIQKVLYANTSDSHGMKYTNETVTIHLAPYTIVSLNGYKNVNTSEIKKGDAV